MNDRLKELLKLNTFGNEADAPSMEELAMMLNPVGSVGKGAKSAKEAIEILKRMMSKDNRKTPIDPTMIQRYLFEQNMQRTNAPQMFANKQAYAKGLKSGEINPLTGTFLKDIQFQQKLRNRVQKALEDKRIQRSLQRTENLKNALGIAPVAGLTQTMKDTANVETRKQSELPEQSERLRGSGLMGKQGDKAMEKLAELLSNETAEQDSLQTDALERLTGSGMFGKKGQNLPALLKAILTRPRP
tara:strand:+ start:3453 stop:4184 length:732 start_codon:yes stop_codon:yes gene_type:complete